MSAKSDQPAEQDPAQPSEGEQAAITVVLDRASLETVKMKSGQYCLLNCDDHQVCPCPGSTLR